MPARRLLAVLSALVLAGTASAPTAMALGELTVPTAPGETVTVTWTGTVLPGANTSSECGLVTDVGADTHTETLIVPTGTYDTVSVTATASITYDGPNDLIVTIRAADGRTASGDNGFIDSDESASLTNPPSGTLEVIACMFAGAVPQMYTGTLTLTAAAVSAAPEETACKAPKPMSFTLPSYVDMNRAGGEPSVQALRDGTLLYAAHAGTTHFYSPEAADEDSTAFAENYQGQVYAWVSDDDGLTWRFVERAVPPDGVAGSGFSDPDFAVDAANNVYLSEINLANVALSKSTDAGHSYELQNIGSMTITDRQWSTAGPENVVFMVGNASGGGTSPSDPVGNSGHIIIRSTDGGRTFSEAFADAGGLGDLVFDHPSGTMYEPHYAGGTLQVAAFRNALDPDPATALTGEIHAVASGVDLASHWPAIDVDVDGNVYIAWDENGGGDRAAGVWYSYSTDGARTWAPPTRVDLSDATDLWPWIAVGAPGRVAVAWFGNDNRLPDNDPEQAGDGDPWNVYVAQTLTGLGCGRTSSPGFTVVKATPEPFHVGTVCTGGTICQAEAIDRRLGDYFTIDVDWSGRLVAAYSDTRQGGAVALPAYFRQDGGTTFNRGKVTGVDR